MAQIPTQSFNKRISARAAFWGRHIVLALGNKPVRWLIIICALVVTAYLAWVDGWQPLQQPGLLPGGVASTNPEVNGELLGQVTTARRERSQYVPKSYASYDFLLQPTVLPTVVNQ